MEAKSRKPGSERLQRAIAYAFDMHGQQTRKGTDIPYMAHTLAVLSIVLEHGGDEDEAVAAVLHDGPEDCGGQERLDDIRTIFGDRVADIVLGCTDTLEHPKPPWKPRKMAYIAHAAAAARSTCLVSAADKLHNARAIERDYLTLGEALWARFNAPKEDVLWYYAELSRIFQQKDLGGLADELARTVSFLLVATGRRS